MTIKMWWSSPFLETIECIVSPHFINSLFIPPFSFYNYVRNCRSNIRICWVSIDRFNAENLNSTVYSLSNCHTDHMVGLNEPELFERLKHYNLKIYCHKVSAAFLSALPLCVQLTPYIITLDSDIETTLNVSLERDEDHNLTVTLILAGHCPGSVMFLKICPFYWQFHMASWLYEAKQSSFRRFTRSCCP